MKKLSPQPASFYKPLETKENHKNQKNHMIFPYDFFL